VAIDQPESAPEPAPRKPRKVFLLVGVVMAAALGVGLFTGLGTNPATSTAPHVGGPVPSFNATNLNGSGSAGLPQDEAQSSGTVILFFGAWCPGCHAELPPLAAAIRHQREAGGALAHIAVIGVDSEDAVGNAKSFIHQSGVTFPVAYDPNDVITEGDFYLTGDPYAVFVKPDGRIDRIVRGEVLTPASFTADERAIIPSGS
jgi:peroxiredoxin